MVKIEGALEELSNAKEQNVLMGRSTADVTRLVRQFEAIVVMPEQYNRFRRRIYGKESRVAEGGLYGKRKCQRASSLTPPINTQLQRARNPRATASPLHPG